MCCGIIDFGGGNIRSVINALACLKVETKLVTNPSDFQQINRLIFPGQAAFKDCVTQLDSRGLREPIQKWLQADRPFFGICIGFQVLFENSEESPGSLGLGFLKGRVRKFENTSLKVPHMGWNSATPTHPERPIWKGLNGDTDPYFYFVHSFYPEPTDSIDLASSTTYGTSFASSVQRGNIFATQFHPEKSQTAGLTLLRNFLTVRF